MEASRWEATTTQLTATVPPSAAKATRPATPTGAATRIAVATPSTSPATQPAVIRLTGSPAEAVEAGPEVASSTPSVAAQRRRTGPEAARTGCAGVAAAPPVGR